MIQYNVLEEAQDINPDFFTNDVNNIIEFIQTNNELFITKSDDAEFFLENGYFNDNLMSSLNLEYQEKIGVTARTQFTLKHFAETLPSEEFRALIDSI